MINFSGLFTSESVADGHPDKICDQISDAILDAYLSKDPSSRVAIETTFKNHTLFICGEVTSHAAVDYERIAKDVLIQVGHAQGTWDLHLNRLQVITEISHQSPDIARGVSETWMMGAGDQGLMFGFACNDTAAFMPLPITLAHALMRRHKEVRTREKNPVLGPDAKAQVTVFYENGRPVSLNTVVLSTQHHPDLAADQLKELVQEEILKPILPRELCKNTTYHINPTGLFVTGGSLADAGLTGRKIIVDTYGGFARHGGGAFSGKDPTKVDRSAAYAARQLALDVVRQKLATACEVRVAYAIGVPQPVAITLETPQGELALESTCAALGLENLVDMFRPYSIIQRLDLRRPLYQATACYGHFGNPTFPWEHSLKREGVQEPLAPQIATQRG